MFRDTCFECWWARSCIWYIYLYRTSGRNYGKHVFLPTRLAHSKVIAWILRSPERTSIAPGACVDPLSLVNMCGFHLVSGRSPTSKVERFCFQGPVDLLVLFPTSRFFQGPVWSNGPFRWRCCFSPQGCRRELCWVGWLEPGLRSLTWQENLVPEPLD